MVATRYESRGASWDRHWRLNPNFDTGIEVWVQWPQCCVRWSRYFPLPQSPLTLSVLVSCFLGSRSRSRSLSRYLSRSCTWTTLRCIACLSPFLHDVPGDKQAAVEDSKNERQRRGRCRNTGGEEKFHVCVVLVLGCMHSRVINK